MKLNKKLVSVIVAASSIGFVAPAISAEAQTFTVTKYNLTGYTDHSYITESVRDQLVELFKQYSGNDLTVQRLNELKDKIQTLLNQKANGIFTVNIPNQKIVDGVVEFNVNFFAGQVNYGSAPGYDEQNVRRSVPSLQKGVQFVAGRPWVDERELTMAVENPLKLTQVEYELQPNKPIVANVNVIAPRGKHVRFFSIDNSINNPSYDYLRGTLGYINGNLTNRDDVLSLVLVSNFRKPQGYHAFGGSYSLPLYDKHQRLDFSLFHSSTKVENFQQQGLTLDMAGKGDVASVNWSYYLPHYDFGYSNQIKLVAGYTFKRLSSLASANGNTFKDSFYFTSPFNVGVTGKIIPYRGFDIDFSAKYNFFYAGILGTDEISKLRVENGRAVTAERFEQWLTGSVALRHALPKNFSSSLSLTGQLTNKHLVASERFSNGVRGFREGAGSGDNGIFLKSEIVTPNFVNKPGIDTRAYAFLDAGYVSFNKKIEDVATTVNNVTTNTRTDVDLLNNPNLAYNFDPSTANSVDTTVVKRSNVAVSAGAGLRLSYKDFSTDVYGAYRIKSTDGRHDKFNIFFSANYKF